MAAVNSYPAAAALVTVYAETASVACTTQGPTSLSLPSYVLNVNGGYAYVDSMNAPSGGIAGNFCQMANGAYVNVTGSLIQGWTNGFLVQNSGAPSNLIVSGTNMDLNTLSLNILQPGSTGNYTGYLSYTNYYIAPTSLFFITGRDSHIITVATTGGDFTSVAAALASITGASPTNRYQIQIGPGVFPEPQLTMIPYVSISGASLSTTTIYGADPTNHLIIAAPNVYMENLMLDFAAQLPSIALVYYQGITAASTDTFGMNNCWLGTADSLIWADSGPTGNSNIVIANSIYGGAFAFNTGFLATSSAAQSSISLFNCGTYAQMANPPTLVMYSSGPYSVIRASNHLSESLPTTGVFGQIDNGGD